MLESSIRILQAHYGDAFVIDCYRGDKHGVVVVDGGVRNASTLKTLTSLDSIDLMVLTHFDDDHIGGIKQYVEHFAKNNMVIPVKEMWLNNSRNLDINATRELSFRSAMKLSDLLENREEWSQLVWKPYIHEGETRDFGFAKIEVISPTEEFQNKMIEKIETFEPQSLSSRKSSRRLDIPLEELAKTEPSPPNIEEYPQLANASSIAFILRCDNLSLLMLGDSYPQNVEQHLRRKGYSEQNPLKVDYVKVSHHGSQNNTSNSLLSIINTHNYIISTNGHKYYHPDRKTIARIVCAPRREDAPINIYMNYPENCFNSIEHQFINEDEPTLYNFHIHYNTSRLP